MLTKYFLLFDFNKALLCIILKKNSKELEEHVIYPTPFTLTKIKGKKSVKKASKQTKDKQQKQQQKHPQNIDK